MSFDLDFLCHQLLQLSTQITDSIHKVIKTDFSGFQGIVQPPQTTRRRKLERIEHDGVLGEYTRRHYVFTDRVLAEGTLCPKDYCLLSIRFGGVEGTQEAVQADRHNDAFISKSYLHAIPFCQECKELYYLGEDSKQIKQSHEEVETLYYHTCFLQKPQFVF